MQEAMPYALCCSGKFHTFTGTSLRCNWSKTVWEHTSPILSFYLSMPYETQNRIYVANCLHATLWGKVAAHLGVELAERFGGHAVKVEYAMLEVGKHPVEPVCKQSHCRVSKHKTVVVGCNNCMHRKLLFLYGQIVFSLIYEYIFVCDFRSSKLTFKTVVLEWKLL